jgi:hypothetical protein
MATARQTKAARRNVTKAQEAATSKKTIAHRALTLWLPMPFALVSLPALRRLSRESLPAEAAGHG